MSDRNDLTDRKAEFGAPLTPEQRDAFDDGGRSAESHVDAGAGFDAGNSDHRLYSVSFDGSWKTNQDDHLSNPAKLHSLVDQIDQSGVEAEYVPGVGTQGGPVDRYLTGGACGDG